MSKYKMVNGVMVMHGSRAYELLESKDPKDHKLAKRLMEYCDKAEKCGYEYAALQKLRKEYADVV